ncbi:methyltransferase domain-containing protein [Nonomuraea sp. MG754425]|uniref:SAM-dependent methyltransferase n=1 Tax=Nonomuraea sp. MG754425 TaxID=2570319 RepID=UPI001F3433D4|nr:methyltransferase domain-containing protein [Nonomuraea sp. MG754425]MCF6476402.1 methyltransferase domain-containing protein [Nonomuraea sp. MG754425]
MDLPRSFTIREHSHRILNPFTSEKLATLGAAIGLRPGASVLDLCCGKGEMLATWARDHGITGTGVDISTVFLAAAHQRAAELGVTGQVTFLHDNAADHMTTGHVDVAACIGATWIGDGVAGTVALLERSLRPGGTILIGEPFWRAEPPDQEAVEGCHAQTREDHQSLPDLIALFDGLGYDVVEMVLADEDSWDRYVAAQWLNIRTWLDAHPDDELAPELRAELSREPTRYTRYQRPLLGWGVFALMKR